MFKTSLLTTLLRVGARLAAPGCAMLVFLAWAPLSWAASGNGEVLGRNKPKPDEVIIQLDGTRPAADVQADLAALGFPTMTEIWSSDPAVGLVVPPRFNYRKVTVNSIDAATLAKIRAVPGIATVRRLYQGAGSVAPIIHTGELVVKFSPNTTAAEVQMLAAKYGAVVSQQIPWLPGGYVWRVPDTDSSDAMSAAIALSSEAKVVYSHPDFFVKDFIGKDEVLIEDTLFPRQWHLRNTGQLQGGKEGADINVVPAWDITEGAGAIAAIIDDCVQKDHEDLKNNYYVGFDEVDLDSDPSPALPGEGHGTACAGLLAAEGNKIGVRGVAPKASLIGVRALGATILGLADAFVFAEASGAMVISNSWGLNYQWAPTIPPILDTILADAVRTVATRGRGGRGALVLFTSGNNNMLLAFNRPTAAQPYVMAIGATMRDDTLACYSSFGPEQSVVAPGGGSAGCYESDIVTTDVQESLIPPVQFPMGMQIRGINPATKMVIDPQSRSWMEVIDPSISDFPNLAYTRHMNGTSAACPIAAGVATLVYSVNPNMTAREVKNLIEHTAKKVQLPNEHFDTVTGHNQRFGHGRVDAYAAVLAAQAGKSWPSPVKNVQTVSSQALVRINWDNPDWDGDGTIDEDVAGVLVVRAPLGQLEWAPVDGLRYDVGQIVAPGTMVVANDLIDSLDQTGLPKGAFEYAIFVRNAANYYSWGRRSNFSSTGAVTVPLASIIANVSTGPAPLSVHFTGAGVDQSPIVAYTWNFGDGSTGSGSVVDHTYTSSGQFTATLTVVNAVGQAAQASTVINVLPGENVPPTAGVKVSPKVGQAPLIVLFEGAGTDVDGTVVRYDWDFGDGTVGAGQVVEHIYLDPGTYGVTLTVTDNAGGQGMASALVTVQADTAAAAEIVTSDQQRGLPGVCGGGAASATIASVIGLCGLMAFRRRR